MSRTWANGDQSSLVGDARMWRECKRVVDRLGRHPDVQIMVSQGWVTLRGQVFQASDRWRVEDAICRVPGIVGASTQLSVRQDPAEAPVASDAASADELLS